MTATLRVPCVHGKWDDHFPPNEKRKSAEYGSLGYERATKGYWWCPGGREPTVEEVTRWLAERRTGQSFNEFLATWFKTATAEELARFAAARESYEKATR